MRFSFRSKGSGWFHESYRHSLASKGIRTSFKQISSRNFAVNQQQQQVPKTEPDLRIDVDAVPKKKQEEIYIDLEAKRKKEEEDKKRERSPYTLKQELERKKLTEELAERPFNQFLNRLKSGTVNSSEIQDAIAQARGDSYRLQLIRNAAFDGGKSLADRGMAPDWSSLESVGLTKFQMQEIAQALVNKVGSAQAVSMGANRYVTGAVAQRAGTAVGGAVGGLVSETVAGAEAGAEAEFQRELAEGARRFEQAPTELELIGAPSTAFQQVDKGQPKIRFDMYGDEVVDRPGMLNPMEIGDLDKYLKQREKASEAKMARLKASERVNYFVDDLYNGKDKLAKIDFSPFKEGQDSYRKGDREGVMRAISALEMENYALKHRLSLVDNVRQQILSSKNVTEMMLKGKDNQGFFFNPMVGHSTGSAAYAEQTDKMAKTGLEIQKSSNAVVQRIAELKRKLAKMNSMARLDEAPPERPVKVFSDQSPGWKETLDDGKSIFRHENPVLKGKTNILSDDYGMEEEM